MMKLGITRYTRYSATDESYEFEVWLQPYYRWVLAHLYRIYDQIWYEIPGGRWFMRRIDARHKNRDWPKHYDDFPWTVRRDLRLYDLFHKGRRTIVDGVPLTEEQFQALKGRGEI